MRHTWILLIVWTVACAEAPYRPSNSALAKAVYEGSPPTLYVGDKSAPISPFDRSYTKLLTGESQVLTEQSFVDGRRAFWVNMATTATSIAALVTALVYRDDFFDSHTPGGRATIGLTVGSALLGAYSGLFTKRSHQKLQQAIHLYNDEVLEQARGGAPLEPARDSK